MRSGSATSHHGRRPQQPADGLLQPKPTVDDKLRTSVPGVRALGDVNGRGALTHTAYHDHQVVAASLLEGAQAAALGRSLQDRRLKRPAT